MPSHCSQLPASLSHGRAVVDTTQLFPRELFRFWRMTRRFSRFGAAESGKNWVPAASLQRNQWIRGRLAASGIFVATNLVAIVCQTGSLKLTAPKVGNFEARFLPLSLHQPKSGFVLQNLSRSGAFIPISSPWKQHQLNQTNQQLNPTGQVCNSASMKWISVLALTGAIYASSVLAQAHIRCQNTIGGPCGDSSRPREMNCCDYGYCQPWNSAYYQCIAKPARCTMFETDIDYYGNDIKAIYGIPPDKCCDACVDTAGCKGYTFVNENPDGKTACFLKNSTMGRREKKGALSGGFADIPPPEKCPLQEIGYDYYGNDIKSVAGISQGDCCEECSKTVYCKAYTWIERGDDGRSYCFLKTGDSGRRIKAGAISGVLKEVPPPADCPMPEYNMDYYGNDIKSMQGVTQGECCDECGKTPSCVAYTFIPQDTNGKSACYLKWSMSGRRGRIGAIGNRRKDPPVAPANCPKQDTDTDYYGNDLKKVVGISNAQCCDECGKTTGCKAYTYIPTDYTSEGKAACYLKTSSAGKVAKGGAISGELKCPTALMGQCGSAATGALCCPEGAFCQPWNPSYYQCIAKPENAKCPTVVTGVDFYGGDLEVKYGLLPSSCCDACFANKDCHVFTFVNFNADGKSACYLKSRLVEQRPRTDAISGYKIKQ